MSWSHPPENRSGPWLNAVLLPILILLMTNTSLSTPATAQNAEEIDRAAWEKECVYLTNQLRAEHDLPPLKAEPILMDTARAHSRDMAERDYLDHVTPEGVTLLDRLQEAGYHPTGYYSENILVGWKSTPETAIAWWYDEEPPDDWHRRNLLTIHHREFGCGIYIDPATRYRRYFTQDFGKRKGVFPLIINREAVSTTTRTISLYLYGESWGATEMMLSENIAFESAEWQPFAPTAAWTLVGETGLRTLYAKIRNARGEIRGPVSDAILLIEQPYEGYLPLILKDAFSPPVPLFPYAQVRQGAIAPSVSR